MTQKMHTTTSCGCLPSQLVECPGGMNLLQLLLFWNEPSLQLSLTNAFATGLSSSSSMHICRLRTPCRPSRCVHVSVYVQGSRENSFSSPHHIWLVFLDYLIELISWHPNDQIQILPNKGGLATSDNLISKNQFDQRFDFKKLVYLLVEIY